MIIPLLISFLLSFIPGVPVSVSGYVVAVTEDFEIGGVVRKHCVYGDSSRDECDNLSDGLADRAYRPCRDRVAVMNLLKHTCRLEPSYRKRHDRAFLVARGQQASLSRRAPACTGPGDLSCGSTHSYLWTEASGPLQCEGTNKVLNGARRDEMHSAGEDLSAHLEFAKATHPGREVHRLNINFPIDLFHVIDWEARRTA